MRNTNDRVKEFIANQPPERQALLGKLHSTIVEKDKSVTPVIEPMMGKEMIIYKAGMMKYGLASVKNYMSLHVLPIYMSKELHAKYEPLLPGASFQKGCINFTNADDVPMSVISKLIADCSKIDLLKIREEQLQQRKQKTKTKAK